MQNCGYDEKDVARMQERVYGLYQLDWMASHGYSIEEFIQSLFNVQNRRLDCARDEQESVEDALQTTRLDEVYDDFEQNSGFLDSGQIYACKGEFFATEYKNAAYVKKLCSLADNGDELYEIYQFDRAGGTAMADRAAAISTRTMYGYVAHLDYSEISGEEYEYPSSILFKTRSEARAAAHNALETEIAEVYDGLASEPPEVCDHGDELAFDDGDHVFRFTVAPIEVPAA